MELIIHINLGRHAQDVGPFTHAPQRIPIYTGPTVLSRPQCRKIWTQAFGGGTGGMRKNKPRKERIFLSGMSITLGRQEPNAQNLYGDIYNARVEIREACGVFPLFQLGLTSIWQYYLRENIQIPALSFPPNAGCDATGSILWSMRTDADGARERRKMRRLPSNIRLFLPAHGAVESLKPHAGRRHSRENLGLPTSERQGRCRSDSDSGARRGEEKRGGIFSNGHNDPLIAPN